MQIAAVFGIAFALTFLAELPDKSMFASLVLGTRYRPAWVWAGAAAAFAVHMGIAVSAGQLLTLLPHRVVDGVVAGLFLAGSAYLWWTSVHPGAEEGADAARHGGPAATFWRVAGTSFGIVFLAEWGDITQITAANLAARYNPLLVFRRRHARPVGGRRTRHHCRRKEHECGADGLDPADNRDHPAWLRYLHRGPRDYRLVHQAGYPSHGDHVPSDAGLISAIMSRDGWRLRPDR